MHFIELYFIIAIVFVLKVKNQGKFFIDLKDKNGYYILENTDYDNFGIKYNKQKSVFEIRDKNRIYQTLTRE